MRTGQAVEQAMRFNENRQPHRRSAHRGADGHGLSSTAPTVIGAASVDGDLDQIQVSQLVTGGGLDGVADCIADPQTRHSAALGVSVVRLTELVSRSNRPLIARPDRPRSRWHRRHHRHSSVGTSALPTTVAAWPSHTARSPGSAVVTAPPPCRWRSLRIPVAPTGVRLRGEAAVRGAGRCRCRAVRGRWPLR